MSKRKRKPVMQQQLRWLQDLELKLTIIHQRLTMARVIWPEFDDTCQELDDLIHDIRNKLTIAQNWREVATQDGFTEDRYTLPENPTEEMIQRVIANLEADIRQAAGNKVTFELWTGRNED